MRIYRYTHPEKGDRFSVKGHGGRIHMMMRWEDGRGRISYHRMSMGREDARELAAGLVAWADADEEGEAQ